MDNDDVVTMSAAYAYDFLDRRISKSVDADGAGSGVAEESQFIYDGLALALALDGDGSLKTRYLSALDQVFADEDALNDLRWTLTDNLGTVRDEVDNDGDVVNHRQYSAFGQITDETNPTGTIYAFAQGILDVETGDQYHWHRYYGADISQWRSEDPIQFAAGDTNIRRYVGNDPVNRTDPTGLFWDWQTIQEMSNAYTEEVLSGNGVKNLGIGAFNAVKEAYLYNHDVSLVGLDTIATAAGYPLRVEMRSAAGQRNDYYDNPHFVKTTLEDAIRAGFAGFSLGATEIGIAVAEYGDSGNVDAFQQHIGGVVGMDIATASFLGMLNRFSRAGTAPCSMPDWNERFAATGINQEGIVGLNGGRIGTGARVYRVFGGNARGLGTGGKHSSWSTVPPDGIADPRSGYGLYPGNSGGFVVEGELTNLNGVTVISANPDPTTPSGALMAPEVIVPDAGTQIRVLRVSGATPAY
jgi:RHS repeat-associated protein